jgi:hypothetical protein
MGQSYALGAMMACLRPQHRFAVLGEPVCWVMSYAIDSSAHSLQTSPLR